MNKQQSEVYKKIRKELKKTSMAATAASRQINAISAPVHPSVRQASSFILTSELHGTLCKWIRNMSSLSF
jgi:hypothetical protein